MDEELSTIDDLVLQNAKTGEVNMSLRGNTDSPIGRTKKLSKGLENQRSNRWG